MTSPDPAVGDEVARVKAIQDNAERLGLVWALRPATVTSSSPVEAMVDGDTQTIGMQSMMGAVYPGDRVYVIKVPPSGNFIVGRALPLPALRARRSSGATLATSTTLSAVTFNVLDELIGDWTNGGPVPVPVVTTFYFPEDGRYDITAVVSLGVDGAAGSLQSASLNVVTAISGWTSVAYRTFWGVGESTGTVTATGVMARSGDSFTLTARQNSTASTALLAFISAMKTSS